MCIVASQRLGKHVPAATDTRNKRRNVGRVVFCTVRVVSKRVCGSLCIFPYFPRPRRIVGGVFYADRVVSKKSRRFVVPRSSCSYYRRTSFILLSIRLHLLLISRIEFLKFLIPLQRGVFTAKHKKKVVSDLLFQVWGYT
jgi:hypothetical protein